MFLTILRWLVLATLIGVIVGPATFAAIGLVSLLAGAANTPIAASILAVEYFGTNVAPYAAVACVVSFVMTGHRSVYPSQVLAIEKSRFIEAPIGEEVDKIETHVRPGNRNIRVRVVRLVRVIKEKIIIIRQDQ